MLNKWQHVSDTIQRQGYFRSLIRSDIRPIKIAPLIPLTLGDLQGLKNKSHLLPVLNVVAVAAVSTVR